MLRNMRLNKHRALLRIEPGCEIVEHHIDGVLLDARSVGVVASERVPIGDEEEALITFLKLYPICQRTHVIAQVQLASRPHATEDALPACRSVRVGVE